MKKSIVLSLVILCLFLSACSQSSNIGMIGSSDGPTAIFVASGKDQDAGTEGKPVRMIRINDEIYYDSGKESTIDARCGVMDGKVNKAVDAYRIPRENNQSNFDGEYEYQVGMDDTMKLVIGGKWIVFNKIIADRDISGYEYCLYLKGTMPNAAKESELIVMTHDKNLAFEKATKSMYSSHSADHLDLYFVDMK